MLFTLRTERALQALGRLAAIAKPGDRVYLEDILNGTDAPRAFLAKVFSRLRRAGIVTALRGRSGGYTLSRPAERITLREIVEAVEGADPRGRSLWRRAVSDPPVDAGWQVRWRPVRAAIQDLMERTTLADLREETDSCDRSRGGARQTVST